ncbi:hypothetical protein CHS0354_020568 [Potamilus streckersoni]|uniref:Uncharacterized protein n=1 Tax=Potamilus streckersoni TaxID=2493646 RepID=A0AAE0SNF9_9BIVA|nr:hypothetical protein CHS0354_020568 [Potamilus streckersoni]
MSTSVSLVTAPSSTNETLPENSSTGNTTTNSTAAISSTDIKMDAGTALGISFGVVTFVFLSGLIIFCLQKRGKLKCCEDGFEKCIQKQRTRKKPFKSLNASKDCLTNEEDEEDKIESTSGRPLETLEAPKLAREIFSIGDHDNDVTRTRERRYSDDAADDGYFYDEIFETSAFVDERTNRSIKNLTEDDDFEDDNIPDIIFRSTS